MPYTVKQVAKLSGVSVRALHFYDEIGLLKPAYVGENGYRFYEQEQLLLLQQILFFRELGISLADTQRIIRSPDFDKIKALQSHRRVLDANLKRTGELLRTIDKTIKSLEEGKPMKGKELYNGFDREKQKEYEQYWIDNGGECGKRLVEESRKNTRDWKKQDYEGAKEEFDRLDKELKKAIERNLDASNLEVQKIIGEHFTLIKRFYEPSKQTYIGLGQMYVQNPDFRKRYDNYHPRQAEFWAEAMRWFAEKTLE